MLREPALRSSKLARRLAEISRRRALGETDGGPEGTGSAGGGPAAEERRDGVRGGVIRAPVAVEELLPGGVLEGPGGAVFVHERLRSTVERRHPGWGVLRRGRSRGGRRGAGPEWMGEGQDESGPLPAGGRAGPASDAAGDGSEVWEPGLAPEAESAPSLAPDVLHQELESLLRCRMERVVFLDLETGGLGGACVFLAGTMRWTGEDFVLRQYFARHYGEEGALLGQVGLVLSEAEAVVTFNGKSFDVPLLRERAARHRLPLPFPALHVDLLHHSRAAWRGVVPDCRLVTLEAYVCRRRRRGDVPGEEIPGLYHEFVRDGDVGRLIPVFHHNLLDVITMDELLRKMI